MIETIEARFETLDERFGLKGDKRIERLHTGCRWTEGPAYFPAGRYLVFSDIPNDRILRWDETTGAVGVFRQPAGFANGHTVDRQGRLVSCEHGTRRVTRTEHDGSVTVLADRYEGKRLNSPNDVVIRSDGSVWFTDPSYGIDSDYEGHRADSEIGACYVYRVRPSDGDLRVVADDFPGPNGLAFSADERQLYIVDSREKHIRRFDVTDAASGPPVRRRGVRHQHRGLVRRDQAGRHRAHLGGGPRRAALLRPGRHAPGQAALPRDRGQLHVRRAAAQRAVRVRLNLAVLHPHQRHRRPLPRVKPLGPGPAPPHNEA